MRIAISGHRGMPIDAQQLIEQTIRQLLASTSNSVTGLTCLADGPDQIFARAVLDRGGDVEVIIPAQRYREQLPEEAHREYDRILPVASKVHRLDFIDSVPKAHMAASSYMVHHADELWAVWDGRPARGYGGTADVVAYAREHGIPVRVIWPHGARRG